MAFSLPLLVTSSAMKDERNRESRPSSPAEMSELTSAVASPLSFSYNHMCQECDKLIESWNKQAAKTTSWARTHHGTLRFRDTMQKSSTCHLCAFFHGLFRLRDQEIWPDDRIGIECSWNTGKDDQKRLNFITVGKISFFSSGKQKLPLHSIASQSEWTGSLKPNDLSTWSSSTVETASEWLSDCTTRHEECSEGQSAFLPSRLLDIGTSNTITPKLVSTVDFTETQRYISLSHRWGGNVPLRLTKTNMVTMSKGVKFQDFPKTFQHALIVTRDLKCRYIWIDSLCIIQDSHKDWLQESSQMHLVYSNAYLTIAATAALDSTEGLFFDRNPLSLIPLHIPIENQMYLIEPPLSKIETEVDESPLNCRAWVYQERFLSRRILHVTACQLFWECKSCSMSESSPNESAPTLPSRLNPRSRSQQLKAKDAGSDIAISALWNEVVRDYSRCKLTKETDRLVAISGVAQRWLEVFQSDDKYLAGMWRKSLPASLLWQVSGERCLPTSYSAPSWSWASVLGQTHVPGFCYSKFASHVAEVLSTNVQLAGTSEFGPVLGGVMTVKGQLMRVPLWVCHYRPKGQANPCEGCRHERDHPDEESQRTLKLTFTLDIPRPQFDQRFRFAAETADIDEAPCLHFPVSAGSSKTWEQGGGELVGLQLLTYFSGLVNYGHSRNHRYGLLLEPTGSGQGEFRRVGTYFWDPPGTNIGETYGEAQFLEASKCFKAQAESLGVQCCEDENGATGEYIVTIV